LRVRFQEIDAMGVVWHGHYVAFFEEGRAAFGRRFGLSYDDLRAAGLTAPVVRVECDYRSPARLEDMLEITTRLHVDDAAAMNFTFEIRRTQGAGEPGLLAWGRTKQVFVTFDGNLLLTRPPLLEGVYQRLRAEMRYA
jgi:acyl-CoA thioester hydrolase